MADKPAKVRDKPKAGAPLVIVELEMFRGQLVPVHIPKGVALKVFDFDVLGLEDSGQILRRGKHSDSPAWCQEEYWEGPII